MRKQTFGRIKKKIAVLLLVVFISALTATSVSAQLARGVATQYAVTFDASRSLDVNNDPIIDSNGNLITPSTLRFAWDFGDGTTGTTSGPVATHVFNDMNMCRHRVTVTAIDDSDPDNTNTNRIYSPRERF
jgi:hypothetical protein